MDDNILDQKWSAGSLLRFAFPTIVMMIFMGLYTIVDTIFVAQFATMVTPPKTGEMAALCSGPHLSYNGREPD